jgi:hypothetical protein
VHHAGDAALDQQRDAEERADALLAQDRVVDVGAVDVVDRQGFLRRRDAPGEALANRDADALFDLLLDALGGPRLQPLAVGFEQENRCRVAVEDLGDAAQ